MVALIFGIVFLIAGCVGGICLYKTPITVYHGYGEKSTKEYRLRKFTLIPIIVGAVLAIVLIFSSCVASIPTGHTGVLTTFGKVEDETLDAGFNTKAPWQSVVKMDNRVQKFNTALSCFSSDIQEVTISYTLNYQINKNNAQEIYKTIGTSYHNTAIVPNVAEAVKVVTARYTAEQLVGSRSELAIAVEEVLRECLASYNIEVVSTAIEDMDFTDSFTAAVEAKAVAAQNKLQAQIEQDRLTMESVQTAERAQIEAEAQAEVDRIKAEAQAKVDKIKAEADQEVAKIGADSAEYQGKKEAAIALQRLASINGWTVVTEVVNDIEIHTLYKANGEKVTSEELATGTQKLLEYYYTQAWDGKLPDTYVGSDDVSTIITNGKEGSN